MQQAGAELGQDQLTLELGFTLIKIFCIKLMTRILIECANWFLIREHFKQ